VRIRNNCLSHTSTELFRTRSFKRWRCRRVLYVRPQIAFSRHLPQCLLAGLSTGLVDIASVKSRFREIRRLLPLRKMPYHVRARPACPACPACPEKRYFPCASPRLVTEGNPGAQRSGRRSPPPQVQSSFERGKPGYRHPSQAKRDADPRRGPRGMQFGSRAAAGQCRTVPHHATRLHHQATTGPVDHRKPGARDSSRPTTMNAQQPSDAWLPFSLDISSL
jgi:hypothetical protein